MREAAGALFYLPDGRVVLQRRTKDAPTGAGKLGFFGGHLDGDETPDQGLRRELSEEVGLDIQKLNFTPLITAELSPQEAGRDYALRVHLYKADIPDMGFAVFEGDGAEAYHVDELRQRSDVSELAVTILTKIFGGANGA